MRKILRQILTLAENDGARWEQTSGNHYKVYCPDGGIVHISGTPSDHRAARNICADLRRHGCPSARI